MFLVLDQQTFGHLTNKQYSRTFHIKSSGGINTFIIDIIGVFLKNNILQEI